MKPTNDEAAALANWNEARGDGIRAAEWWTLLANGWGEHTQARHYYLQRAHEAVARHGIPDVTARPAT